MFKNKKTFNGIYGRPYDYTCYPLSGYWAWRDARGNVLSHGNVNLDDYEEKTIDMCVDGKSQPCTVLVKKKKLSKDDRMRLAFIQKDLSNSLEMSLHLEDPLLRERVINACAEYKAFIEDVIKHQEK